MSLFQNAYLFSGVFAHSTQACQFRPEILTMGFAQYLKVVIHKRCIYHGRNDYA